MKRHGAEILGDVKMTHPHYLQKASAQSHVLWWRSRFEKRMIEYFCFEGALSIILFDWHKKEIFQSLDASSQKKEIFSEHFSWD